MPFGQICLGLWMESGNEQQCGSEVALNGPSGVHRSHGRNRWRVRSVGKWQSASRHHQQMCIVKFPGAAASFVASDVMLAAVPSAVGSLGAARRSGRPHLPAVSRFRDRLAQRGYTAVTVSMRLCIRRRGMASRKPAVHFRNKSGPITDLWLSTPSLLQQRFHLPDERRDLLQPVATSGQGRRPDGASSGRLPLSRRRQAD